MSTLISFLTLGLTADAAAHHRHAFSSPDTSTSSHTTHSLTSRTTRSPTPLQTLSTILSQSCNPTTTTTTTTPTPTPTPKPQEQQQEEEQQKQQPLTISTMDSTGNQHTPKSKQQRTKTSYQLAAPPPSHHTTRIHAVVRPSRALVLQLQRLSPSARPLPAYDVIPALAFAAKSRRKRPMNFRANLALHDLVILTSEEYTDEDEEGTEDEDLSNRSVIASISPVLKKDENARGQLELAGGVIWEASQRGNGSYEFVCRQPNGVTLNARWIARSPNSRRRSSQTAASPVSPTIDSRASSQQEKKFQFSMINSSTRRHPILATMSSQRIDIFDQHSIPATVHSRPTTPMQEGSSRMESVSNYSHSDLETDKVMVETDEHIKTLILVTGTWVALRERLDGKTWFDESAASPTSVRTSFPSRVVSSPLDNSTTPKSEKRHSDSRLADRILRRGTLLGHAATTNMSSDGEPTTPMSTRRANSTGSNCKRPVRIAVPTVLPKLGSSRNSPASTRAPSPEPTINLGPESFTMDDQDAPDPIPPMKRAIPLSLHRHRSNGSVSFPKSSKAAQPRPKQEKERRWRMSMPAKVGEKVDGERKRSLRQKLGRVFHILRRTE